MSFHNHLEIDSNLGTSTTLDTIELKWATPPKKKLQWRYKHERALWFSE